MIITVNVPCSNLYIILPKNMHPIMIIINITIRISFTASNDLYIVVNVGLNMCKITNITYLKMNNDK